MFCAPANSNGIRDISFIGSASHTSFASLYSDTFSGVNIGTPAADRMVFLIISAEAYQNIPVTVTVGGVSLTRVTNITNIYNLSMTAWYGRVPTGSSADVVIDGYDIGDRYWLSIHLHVYAIYGGVSAVSADYQDGGSNYTGPYWNNIIPYPNARHILGDNGRSLGTNLGITYNATFADAKTEVGTSRYSAPTTYCHTSRTAVVNSHLLTAPTYSGADGAGYITYATTTATSYGTSLYSIF